MTTTPRAQRTHSLVARDYAETHLPLVRCRGARVAFSTENTQSRRLERAASTDGTPAAPAGEHTPQVQSPEGAPWALSPTGGAITTLLHTPGAEACVTAQHHKPVTQGAVTPC